MLSNLPKEKKFINKIKKLINTRSVMFEQDKLDWSMGEMLAYGTLLKEGYNVRISGQDVRKRNFFTQTWSY